MPRGSRGRRAAERVVACRYSARELWAVAEVASGRGCSLLKKTGIWMRMRSGFCFWRKGVDVVTTRGFLSWPALVLRPNLWRCFGGE
jgi:hypothetical protein